MSALDAQLSTLLMVLSSAISIAVARSVGGEGPAISGARRAATGGDFLDHIPSKFVPGGTLMKTAARKQMSRIAKLAKTTGLAT